MITLFLPRKELRINLCNIMEVVVQQFLEVCELAIPDVEPSQGYLLLKKTLRSESHVHLSSWWPGVFQHSWLL